MALALRFVVDLDDIDIPPVPIDPVDAYRRRAQKLAAELYRAAINSTPRTEANDRAVRDYLLSIVDQAQAIAPCWVKRLRDLAALIDAMSRRLNCQPIPGGRLIEIARAIAGAANQPWDAGTLPSAGGAA